MKKISIGIIAGLTVVLLFSFSALYELSNKTAEVNTFDNIVVFAESKPVKDYTVIGHLKAPTISFGQADGFSAGRDYLVEKCKESYPTGEGLILDCSKTKLSADVITFKK